MEGSRAQDWLLVYVQESLESRGKYNVCYILVTCLLHVGKVCSQMITVMFAYVGQIYPHLVGAMCVTYRSGSVTFDKRLRNQ